MKQVSLLAIVGPTASGKTPLSLLFAERLDVEIVSADSRQIYKYLDIGTAKPVSSDLRRIPHHFIDVLDPAEDYNAGQYGKEARETILDIIARKKTPVLIGGSGLYIRSVIDGLFEGPGRDPEIRSRLEEEQREEGVDGLLRRLKDVDPVSYEAMRKEPKARRIVRALEVYYITAKPLSSFHGKQEKKSTVRAIQIALDWPREELYRMIDERVEKMMQAGFEKEVSLLLAKKYDRRLNSLNTVGYKEMLEYLDGKRPMDETIAIIKRNTRRFAKRQLTWFRRDKRIKWIHMKEGRGFEEAASEVEKHYARGKR